MKDYIMYEEIGTWWNDNNIPLVKINGTVYALHGWNGEKYNHCWICTGKFYMDSSSEEYEIRPIYSEANEDGDTEIVGYEVG